MARPKTDVHRTERLRQVQRSWYEQSRLGPIYVSAEVILYSIDDLVEMTGWSHGTVQKLFNDPKFPSIDYGRRKLVENHSLMQYLSVRHEKELDSFWRSTPVKRKK